MTSNGQTPPNTPLDESAIEIYKEICTNIRVTDETSFKLLSTVPILSGVGSAALTILEKSKLLESYSEIAVACLSLLGLVITFGLFRWEIRNIQKCNWLIGRAGDYERKLFGYGNPSRSEIQFDCMPGDTKASSIFCRPWGKTQAEKIIYTGAMGTWLVPLAIALYKIYAGT